VKCLSCSTELAESSRFCSVCGYDHESSDESQQTSGSGTALMARLAEVLQGRYRITRMAGRGGMAAVFLAHDLTLERPVAVKALPPEVSHDDRLVGRFEREARTAAKLDHPNIIPIYAVEHSNDLYYFIMKYVDGESLDQLIKRGRLPIERVQDLLWESARALGHAHQRGVIHRDVKPANIMIDHDGRVILTDFGISKAMQSATQFTGTGQVIGTPHYMSPEQAKGGGVDGRSDQYALGIVGYQMVTGRLPFGEDSIHAVIYKHVSEEPPPIQNLNPDCPPFLSTAIHRALRKRPADRFQSMDAFAQAVCPDRRLSVSTTASPRFGSVVSSVASGPTEISHTTVTGSRGRRSGWVKAMVVGLPFVAAGAGGYWSWSAGWLTRIGLAGPTVTANSGPATSQADGGRVAPNHPQLASANDTSTVAETEELAATGGTVDSGRANVAARQPERSDPVAGGSNPPNRTVIDQGQQRAPTRRVGWITIDTDPYGQVFIDDVAIDDTPVFEFEIEVGEHVIRVVNDRCQQLVDTVTVVAGDVMRVIKALICNR
jgi:serine/threonine protein kinase